MDLALSRALPVLLSAATHLSAPPELETAASFDYLLLRTFLWGAGAGSVLGLALGCCAANCGRAILQSTACYFLELEPRGAPRRRQVFVG